MDPILIHCYEILPPKSILQFNRTPESDIFTLEIKRIVEDAWTLNSHKTPSSDIAAFNSLIDFDHTSLLGRLRITSEEIEEEYDFKILRPGHIQKIAEKGKYIKSVSTTYLICGSMIPIPIIVPVIEALPIEMTVMEPESTEPEERDRFDLIGDEEL
jgi:hypothetical protein